MICPPLGAVITLRQMLWRVCRDAQFGGFLFAAPCPHSACGMQVEAVEAAGAVDRRPESDCVYCQQPASGYCDNPACQRTFHPACARAYTLTPDPASEVFCPECASQHGDALTARARAEAMRSADLRTTDLSDAVAGAVRSPLPPPSPSELLPTSMSTAYMCVYAHLQPPTACVQVQQHIDAQRAAGCSDIRGLSVRQLGRVHGHRTLEQGLVRAYSPAELGVAPDHQGRVEVPCWTVTLVLFQLLPGEGEWIEFFLQTTVRLLPLPAAFVQCGTAAQLQGATAS